MKSLIPVFKREYLQRVRSRWFIFGTFLAPALLLGMMVVPMVLETRSQETKRNVALVDETGVLSKEVTPRLEEAGFTVRQETPDREEALRQEVTAGDLGGFIVLPEAALTRGLVEYHGRQGPGAVTGLTLRNIVAQAALEARLEAAGDALDLRAILSGGELEVVLMESGGGGASENDPKFAGAFGGAMLLYMVILLYAVAVMRATLEEKTSRVVEILISSVKPSELMLGKILGVGSVGLTQLVVWVTLGILALTMGLPAVMAAQPDLLDPDTIAQALPGVGLSALFVGLFLGGYFIYAALYAAVGAMCSTEEEAQQAHLPVMMLLIVPIMFLMPVIENPNSPMAVAASLVPFFSPVLMYARAATGAVPMWQIVTALALLIVGVWVVAWLAGRIYRVGILMQGKRPTLPELWRWVRAA
jgi:ABC-2 type transport system permease protein